MHLPEHKFIAQFDLDANAIAMILRSLETTIEDWSQGGNSEDLELMSQLRLTFFAALPDCQYKSQG